MKITRKKQDMYENWEYISYAILFCLMLFILYKAPMRLDDWTWGSNIGIERLKNWFYGYNGRYVGNIIVILLLRIPTLSRALIQIAILLLCFKIVYLILQKNKYSLMCFLMAFMMMPLEVYSETITWVAGYANYIISLFFLLLSIYVGLEALKNKRYNDKQNVFFCILIFGGQLILETVTVYTCIYFAAILAIYVLKYKKILKTLLAYFLSAVAGALVMFSNTSYLSAFLGDGGNYKEIKLNGGGITIIKAAWETFCKTIAPVWFNNSQVISIVLLIVMLFLWEYSNKKYKRRMQVLGLCIVSFVIYDVLDKQWENVIDNSNTFLALTVVGIIVYVLATIIFAIPELNYKSYFLILALSQIVLIAPLLFISPINDRCFLHGYVLEYILIAASIGYLFEKQIEKKREIISIDSMRRITISFVTVIMCVSGWTQSLSWDIEDIRLNEIENAKQRGAQNLTLPYVPWSSQYCYGINISNEDQYWINNFKNYYDIPDSIQLTFVDYYKWKEKQ